MTFTLVALNVLLGGTVVSGLLRLLAHGVRSDVAPRPQIETRSESLAGERLAA